MAFRWTNILSDGTREIGRVPAMNRIHSQCHVLFVFILSMHFITPSTSIIAVDFPFLTPS